MIVHLMKSRGRKNVNRLYKMAKEFADRYREEGCWLGETFGGVLRERAENMEIKLRL